MRRASPRCLRIGRPSERLSWSQELQGFSCFPCGRLKLDLVEAVRIRARLGRDFAGNDKIIPIERIHSEVFYGKNMGSILEVTQKTLGQLKSGGRFFTTLTKSLSLQVMIRSPFEARVTAHGSLIFSPGDVTCSPPPFQTFPLPDP